MPPARVQPCESSKSAHVGLYLDCSGSPPPLLAQQPVNKQCRQLTLNPLSRSRSLDLEH